MKSLLKCNLLFLLILTGCSEKYTIETTDELSIVSNQNGATLAYSNHSGVNLIVQNGYAFKDLNKNGSLDAYEDWRLDVPKVGI